MFNLSFLYMNRHFVVKDLKNFETAWDSFSCFTGDLIPIGPAGLCPGPPRLAFL